MKKYIALDIGGSAIKYAYLSGAGEFLEKGEIPTPLDSLENLLQEIKKIYNQYPSSSGIGISMPGVIDMNKGIAHTGGALLYIKDTPIASLISTMCGVPVTVGNDAKLAGFAEVGFGCLKDTKDAVALIFGTGIGGCIIKDGVVHQGRHFAAGEVSPLKTNTFEPFASNQIWCNQNGTSGLLRQVQQALQEETMYNGKQIFEMASNGNEKVIHAIDLFTRDIAVQIFNIQAIFDPEKFAIGGGISAQPLFIEMIRKNVEYVCSHSGVHPIATPKIVACEYRNDANLLGAFYQHVQQ